MQLDDDLWVDGSQPLLLVAYRRIDRYTGSLVSFRFLDVP